jgi:hypothetical protein
MRPPKPEPGHAAMVRSIDSAVNPPPPWDGVPLTFPLMH